MTREQLKEEIRFRRDYIKDLKAQIRHYENPFDIEISRATITELEGEIYDLEEKLGYKH